MTMTNSMLKTTLLASLLGIAMIAPASAYSGFGYGRGVTGGGSTPYVPPGFYPDPPAGSMPQTFENPRYAAPLQPPAYSPPAAIDPAQASWAQQALNTLTGTNLPVDGIWSNVWMAELASWQRVNALPPSGMLTVATMGRLTIALNALPPLPPTGS